MNWRYKSASVVSKGSAYKQLGKVKSLADLHEARSVHDSQFFTPLSVVDVIWKILQPLCDAAVKEGRQVPILDNSIGSGALLAYADPKKHSIFGCDLDGKSIAALESDLSAAGFEFELRKSSMSEIRVSGMGVAVINPPFSIHLASPALEPLECTCFGKYGPNTHAISHEYALEQALKAAQAVVAVLPSNYAHALESERLLAVLDLPGDAFASEGANVRTSLALFDGFPTNNAVLRGKSSEVDLAAISGLFSSLQVPAFRPRIRHFHRAWSGPSILTPVTGVPDVRVFRSRDHIKLHFKCGFVEARVRNAILGNRVDPTMPHRIPDHLPFTGSGKLYLPFYFAAEDPIAELNKLEALIELHGGRPRVCRDLSGYVRRQSKRFALQRGGYARWIQSQETISDSAEVQKSFVADPRVFPAIVIKKGETVKILKMDGAEWHIERADGSRVLCVRERVQGAVELSRSLPQWNRKGSSMAERMPERAKAMKARCDAAGVFDFYSWDFQREDLLEALMGHRGALVSHKQGLGKTRHAYAVAMATQSSRSVIITLPSLLDQFIEEAKSIGVPVHVISKPSDIQNLGRINLITTSRLRCTVKGTKRTFAKSLRHRFGTVILDEADLLRNAKSQQSSAIRQLGGVRKIGLSGTPIANYPRNLIPVASWVHGDGNIIQPFAERKAYPDSVGLQNCNYCKRGLDVFLEKHVCLEWSTHEFREDQQQGAKREIPSIRGLSEYREYASRLMIRRLREEPDVAKYFPEILIESEVHTIAWEKPHLAHYIEVADDFKKWFTSHSDSGRNNLSLVVLLARIGAVIAACNHPQFPTKQSRAFYGANAKVDAVLDRVESESDAGRKSIVFLHSPKQAAFLQREAEARGIEGILLSGEVDQATRTTELRDRFRSGQAKVCFATFGVARYGLNIPEPSTVIFYDRSWSDTDENQALYRVLRPQQTHNVKIHYFHHEHSIDCYQAQMVAFKKDAAASGLDFAEPTEDASHFLHMDHIFQSFCQDIKKLYGVATNSELRDLLRSA